MTMIRKQFFIDRDKSQKLQLMAQARGMSEAELIRAGVDRILAELASETSDWKQKFQATIDSLGDFDGEGLARRVAENKKRQAELWDKRMARNRRQLEGK